MGGGRWTVRDLGLLVLVIACALAVYRMCADNLLFAADLFDARRSDVAGVRKAWLLGALAVLVVRSRGMTRSGRFLGLAGILAVTQGLKILGGGIQPGFSPDYSQFFDGVVSFAAMGFAAIGVVTRLPWNRHAPRAEGGGSGIEEDPHDVGW